MATIIIIITNLNKTLLSNINIRFLSINNQPLFLINNATTGVTLLKILLSNAIFSPVRLMSVLLLYTSSPCWCNDGGKITQTLLSNARLHYMDLRFRLRLLAWVTRRWIGFTSDCFPLWIGVSVTRRWGNPENFGGRNRSESHSLEVKWKSIRSTSLSIPSGIITEY